MMIVIQVTVELCVNMSGFYHIRINLHNLFSLFSKALTQIPVRQRVIVVIIIVVYVLVLLIPSLFVL